MTASTTELGTLYVVATPIGNPRDMTLRALDVINEVNVIFAEDTRKTKTLLNQLRVPAKSVVRLDANAGVRELDRALQRILAGEKAVLLTDAGTPSISDPGQKFVCRAIAAGVPVVPIPGVSAVVAAVSIAGFSDSGFIFLGFFPRAGKERASCIERMQTETQSIVFFESPRRIGETLSELAQFMPTRGCLVAREMTKIHEEFLRGTLSEIVSKNADREWLGEITVILGPWQPNVQRCSEQEIQVQLEAQIASGKSIRDAAKNVAESLGLNKREVYQRALAIRV